VLTNVPPSVIRLSRQCGILNISQPYRPPEAVTGIALLYFLQYKDAIGKFYNQGLRNVHSVQILREL
jgi:hypothetical protein